MGNKSQLKISEKLSSALENLPERGMGFHIVDIEMINGDILKDRVIINSTYLQLNEGEHIESENIVLIKNK